MDNGIRFTQLFKFKGTINKQCTILEDLFILFTTLQSCLSLQIFDNQPYANRYLITNHMKIYI